MKRQTKAKRHTKTTKRKTPTCIADDPEFTRIDIYHGEPLWVSGDPAISSASEPAIVSVTTPTRTELQVEILQLRAKLHRIRDWLKHMANSPGGIVAEIDELLKLEGK